jgi:hypothetical protein
MNSKTIAFEPVCGRFKSGFPRGTSFIGLGWNRQFDYEMLIATKILSGFNLTSK